MAWSPKQASAIYHSDAFINIADGAIRSGKTFSELIRFAMFAADGPAGDLAVFGKTEKTLKRNVIYPLIQGMPSGTVKYNQGLGELYVFDRLVWLVGANDVRAEEKVRGMTLAGGYMNEVTLYPKEVFDQAIARSLQTAGAQWFADCNPDNPFHWLKNDYLDVGHPKSYLKRWRFKLEDNPILPPANIEMLKALYGGPGNLFYRRNIDGEWVAAEGAVYPMLDIEPGGAHVVTKGQLPSRFERYIVGVDYATATVTVFLLLGKSGKDWYVLGEYYHDARKEGAWQKSPEEHAGEFVEWIGRYNVAPTSIEVDPSAAAFKLALRKTGFRNVFDADHDVKEGIETVTTAFSARRLKILEDCANTLRELSGYVWDEKAVERGEDKPLKRDDHAPDALRYAAMRIWSGVRRSMRVVR